MVFATHNPAWGEVTFSYVIDELLKRSHNPAWGEVTLRIKGSATMTVRS